MSDYRAFMVKQAEKWGIPIPNRKNDDYLGDYLLASRERDELKALLKEGATINITSSRWPEWRQEAQDATLNEAEKNKFRQLQAIRRSAKRRRKPKDDQTS